MKRVSEGFIHVLVGHFFPKRWQRMWWIWGELMVALMVCDLLLFGAISFTGMSVASISYFVSYYVGSSMR
jgi:hypothetical protein